MTFRRFFLGARAVLLIALLSGLAACSDAPRPRAPSRTVDHPPARSKRPQTSTGLADRAVIDDRDLVRGDAGALPPELLEILHAGPGGPRQDGDDIALELDANGNLVHDAFESGAPSIVDAEVLAPESDL